MRASVRSRVTPALWTTMSTPPCFSVSVRRDARAGASGRSRREQQRAADVARDLLSAASSSGRSRHTHVRAFGREHVRGRLADAARGAGDERDLAASGCVQRVVAVPARQRRVTRSGCALTNADALESKKRSDGTRRAPRRPLPRRSGSRSRPCRRSPWPALRSKPSSAARAAACAGVRALSGGRASRSPRAARRSSAGSHGLNVRQSSLRSAGVSRCVASITIACTRSPARGLLDDDPRRPRVGLARAGERRRAAPRPAAAPRRRRAPASARALRRARPAPRPAPLLPSSGRSTLRAVRALEPLRQRDRQLGARHDVARELVLAELHQHVGHRSLPCGEPARQVRRAPRRVARRTPGPPEHRRRPRAAAPAAA